jgi:hypothetical protein
MAASVYGTGRTSQINNQSSDALAFLIGTTLFLFGRTRLHLRTSPSRHLIHPNKSVFPKSDITSLEYDLASRLVARTPKGFWMINIDFHPEVLKFNTWFRSWHLPTK